MLTTFDSLKKNYKEKMKIYKNLDDDMKLPIVYQNKRKLSYLEEKLENIKLVEYSPIVYYSRKYFLAGKTLAVARLEFEIDLLRACNNIIIGISNEDAVDFEKYSTEKINAELNNILLKY